jgi:hypothetical protein
MQETMKLGTSLCRQARTGWTFVVPLMKSKSQVQFKGDFEIL